MDRDSNPLLSAEWTLKPSFTENEKTAISMIQKAMGVSKDDVCKIAMVEFARTLANNPDRLADIMAERLLNILDQDKQAAAQHLPPQLPQQKKT